MFKIGDVVRVKVFKAEEWWERASVQERHALGYWHDPRADVVRYCGCVGSICDLKQHDYGPLLHSVMLEEDDHAKYFLEWELELSNGEG